MSEKNNFATQQFNLVKDRNEFAGWTVSDLTKEGGQGSVCGIKNGRQKRVFKCLKENPESESVARFIRDILLYLILFFLFIQSSHSQVDNKEDVATERQRTVVREFFDKFDESELNFEVWGVSGAERYRQT